MARTIASEFTKKRLSVGVLMIGLLAGSAGQAWAAAAFQTPPNFSASRTFETSRGTGIITGGFGSVQTTTLPGSPGEGFLTNNGNGTSTLLTPGGVPQVIGTPR